MHKRIWIVTGLGFGDETKGATVDALACHYPDIDLVVRHNGGAQAAHNVVTAGGLHHTFAQWGSASFIPRTRTLLSRYMLTNPITLLNEADALVAKGVSVKGRMYIDHRSLVTTPFHVLLNRAREQARGVAHHGTTGMGISETVLDYLTVGEEALTVGDIHRADLNERVNLLHQVKDRLSIEMERLGGVDPFDRICIFTIAELYGQFCDMTTMLGPYEVKQLMQKSKGIVFEGAQGVLLDQNCGFHPHTTWSNTTDQNPVELIKENDLLKEKVAALGVTRTYHTRHGAGPFPTEQPGHEFHPAEPHNADDTAAGQFRRGWLDFTLLKYAKNQMLWLNGLVVSHCDMFPLRYALINPELHGEESRDTLQEQEGLTRKAFIPVPHHKYEHMPEDPAEFIAEELSVPLFMKSSGPKRDDREIVFKGEPAI